MFRLVDRSFAPLGFDAGSVSLEEHLPSSKPTFKDVDKTVIIEVKNYQSDLYTSERHRQHAKGNKIPVFVHTVALMPALFTTFKQPR